MQLEHAQIRISRGLAIIMHTAIVYNFRFREITRPIIRYHRGFHKPLP